MRQWDVKEEKFMVTEAKDRCTLVSLTVGPFMDRHTPVR